MELLVKGFESSGLSQAEYAKRQGVCVATVANWIRRVKRSRGSKARFVEARRGIRAEDGMQPIASSYCAGELEANYELVFSSNGTGSQGRLRVDRLRVEGAFDPGQLKELVVILKRHG